MRFGFAAPCCMASHYTRKRSPYYWLRIKKADGTWSDVSSGIRIDSIGALRKVHQRVASETAKEERQENDGSEAMLRNWVPKWFGYHYKNVKSLNRARNAWAHLSSFFKEKNVLHPEEVTYALCHEYMTWRTDEDLCEEEGRRCGNWNTALTEIRLLGAIMTEALARGFIIANPCARLRLGRKNIKEKSPVERDEQADIETKLKAAPQWMQDAWLVGIKQGNRLSACMVPMKDINVATNVIPFIQKGGKIHPAPLHRDLLPLIERRQREKAEFLVDLPDNASKLINQWLTNHGYPHLSFHSLRVTVITRLALADVTAEKAMQYVGHCSALVHAIYRKLKPRDVASLGDHL